MEAEAAQARLDELTKKLEKDLYKINSLLKDSASFSQPTQEVLRHLDLMETLAGENPGLKQKLQAELKSRNLISLFKEFSFSMSRLKNNVDELQERIMKANMFLESHRGYRVYSFDSLRKASDFIEKSLSMLGIANVLFSPLFLGTIDLKEFSEELDAPRQGSQLVLMQEKTARLFSLIEKKKLNKSFKLEAEIIRFLFKSPGEIIVETNSDNIKRLDHLAKELEGSYAEQ